jgi:endonuclease/exonuclease/phosphatase family metal-dependent hydrolase
VTNDAFNIYLLVEFEAPLTLGTADLRLLIDADNGPATGTPSDGRGMDFSWDFDRNRGTSTLTFRGDIGRGNLIHRVAPYTASTVHEIAISMEALPAARVGAPIYLSLVEENSFDRVPDVGQTLAYTPTGPLAVQRLPIETRRTPRTVRIMSWNVLRDAPFKSSTDLDRLLRVLTAVQADIVLLQEIYDEPTADILTWFRNNLQLPSGYEWSIARNNDCVTLSSFPTVGSWPSNGNLVSRHATEDVLGYQLLIANTHLPCCTDGESGRVAESANLLSVLNSRYNDQTSAPQSVIIGGDLNSGGLAPELIDLTTTLMPLEMSSSRHVFHYDQFSWGSRGSSFGSSKLDFLLFDPATLMRYKAFLIDTDLLPADALTAMGLELNDTYLANQSDHLPLVVDFSSRTLSALLQASPMAANGDCASDWWGKFNGYLYPIILHERLGWLWLYETTNGYWYADVGGAWYYTRPDLYPWFYSVSDAEWQYDHLQALQQTS